MKNGKHLIIDAYDCNWSRLWSEERIREALLAVTDMIGLKPLSEALIYKVDESMIEKKDTGITGGIIFMESHFTFHSFPEQKYFSADIYSCKDFDHDMVIFYLEEAFEVTHMNSTVLLRGTLL